MTDFLIAAAPYYLIFFALILLSIIVFKILINRKEKRLAAKPQENRFDLEDFEDKENDRH